MDFYGTIIKHLTCYLSVFFTIATLAVRGQCPEDASMKSHNCIAPLMMYLKPADNNTASGGQEDPEQIRAQESAKRVKKACREGQFETAMNCIQKIQEECKHEATNSAHFMRKQVNLDELREGTDFLCNNYDEYVKYSDCIGSQKEKLTECAADDLKNLKTLTEATQNMDAHLSFQCILYAKAYKCSTSIITDGCGKTAGDIVATILRLNRPPICSGISYTIPSKRTGDTDSETGDSETGDSETGDSETEDTQNSGHNSSSQITTSLVHSNLLYVIYLTIVSIMTFVLSN